MVPEIETESAHETTTDGDVRLIDHRVVVRLTLRDRLRVLFGRRIVIRMADTIGKGPLPSSAILRVVSLLASLRVTVEKRDPTVRAIDRAFAEARRQTLREIFDEIREETTPRGPLEEIRELEEERSDDPR